MGRSILEWSVRALLMVLATGVTLRVLRIRAASSLHVAWSAALVAMLLLPVWTKWGPSVTARILSAPLDHVAGAVTEIPTAPWRSATADPARSRTPVITRDLPGLQSALTSAPPAKPRDWRQILLGVYFLGMALMLVRLIAGTIQVRSILGRARVDDGFATSKSCGAPVTIGWLRPTLLLPDSWRTWSPAKLESVLIHEREHIRRRDPLVQWLALLNRCIFWFHPVAWWLERRLALLAEEACDAAVIAHGHAPHDYARYLIEIARSVNENGARLRWAGAVAFAAGKLPRRIRRIMDLDLVARTSRLKSLAAAGLCALFLITCLACSLGRTSHLASGEISIAERQQEEFAKNREQRLLLQQKIQGVANVVRDLTPATARDLEADLKAHPGDQDKMVELFRYYQLPKRNLRALDSLTLWYIANHPEVRQSWGMRSGWDVAWDHDVYVRGSQVWSEQLKKSWDNPFVYMNAAEFLESGDAAHANEQIEQILLEGRRRFPATGKYSGLHWELFLARYYVPALQGPSGQQVRATLLESQDPELLLRTVGELQSDRANLDLAITLNAHLLAVKPDEPFAHMQRWNLNRRAATLNGKDPDAAQMASLEMQLTHPAMFPNGNEAEVKAKELLALASRNPKNQDYGTAVFLGDLALGDAAFDRGDKKEALRLLAAASEAPPTEYMRYWQIDMSLVGKLIDAGERDAAATFLERCAKFNHANLPLAGWAAEIRNGKNPRLMPSADIFRKARYLSVNPAFMRQAVFIRDAGGGIKQQPALRPRYLSPVPARARVGPPAMQDLYMRF